MLSLHDGLLVSYEVQCEARTIVLRIEHRTNGVTTKFAMAMFESVEGYRLNNDAFGNIILALEEVPTDRLLKEFGAEIAESYRTSGSPGPWAANLASAPEYLHRLGVRGFLLQSSYGLSGWILARQVSHD